MPSRVTVAGLRSGVHVKMGAYHPTDLLNGELKLMFGFSTIKPFKFTFHGGQEF